MYNFPKINNINDILAVIEGKDEFIICDKGDYRVVNYVYKTDTTFPPVLTEQDALLRECRGIMFSSDGRVIRRPYHKFFNVNERPETADNAIDFSRKHLILEKLDGSMVTPFVITQYGPVRWGTKMGETDISAQAEAYLMNVKKMAYIGLVREVIQDGCTPIFEWCSRKNRVVIDHPEDKLILTAIRNNWSGMYWPVDQMERVAAFYGVPTVRSFDTSISDIQKFIAEARSLQDIEGYVVRFDDGHMLKVKADWYVLVHMTKDMINSERKVVDCIVNDRIDDVMATLALDVDKERVKKYSEEFIGMIIARSMQIGSVTCFCKENYTRKDFALVQIFSQTKRGIIFHFWDIDTTKTMDFYKYVRDIIKKHCGNNKNFMKIKNEFFRELEYVTT